MKSKIIFIFISILFFYGASSAQEKIAEISGTFDFLKDKDTAIITTYKYGYPFMNAFYESDTVLSIGNSISHTFNVENESTYLDIYFPQHMNNFFRLYFVNPGDKINIAMSDGKVSFSGQGSETFKLKSEIDSIRNNFSNARKFDFKAVGSCTKYFTGADSVRKKCLGLLNSQKERFSKETYGRLMADIILADELGKLSVIRYLREVFYGTIPNQILNEWVSCFNDDKVFLDFRNTNTDILQASPYYISYVILGYRIDFNILKNEQFSIDSLFSFITSKFSGLIRDKLITQFLYDSRTKGYSNYLALLDKGINLVQTSEFNSLLLSLKSTLGLGAKAYNFNLKDTSGHHYRLSDFSGKVVVIDLWYTGCGNCINLQPYLRTVERKFLNQPVVFLSVCVDPDRKSWIKSILSGKYTSELSMNLFTNGNGESDPLLTTYRVNAYPTVLLINKAGEICETPLDARQDNGHDLELRIYKALAQ